MKGPWKVKAAFTRGNDNFKYYAAGNYYDTDADGTVNGHEMTDAEYDVGRGGSHVDYRQCWSVPSCA